LKVLLTVHAFLPRHYHGTERYTFHIAQSLQSMDCDVVVLTVGDHLDDSTGDLLTEYLYEGIRVIAVNARLVGGSRFRRSYERPELNGIFRQILQKEEPDLLHSCHLLNLGATIIDLAKEAKLPVVCSLTDFFGICSTMRLTTRRGKPCDGPSSNGVDCIADVYNHALIGIPGRVGNVLRLLGQLAPDFFWMAFEKWANSSLGRILKLPIEDIRLRKQRLFEYYRQVDVFLTTSDCVRDMCVAHGLPAERFVIIPPGVTQPNPLEMVALEKRYADLKSGSPLIFGFIGQVARHKGVDLLVKAFQHAELPHAELHIYGDLNQEWETGKCLLAASKANPRIKCLGTFDGREIYQKLSFIHILCVPSQWHENAPLVLLNGLASKTFLIVSQAKGLVEFVQDGISGFVFEMSGLESLTLALRQAYERRDGLAERFRTLPGYKVTPADYGWQVYRIYDELLNNYRCATRWRSPVGQSSSDSE